MGDLRPIDEFIIKYVKDVKTPEQARQWYHNQDIGTKESVREGAALDYIVKKATK